MRQSVALISLYPISGLGGGERYTFATYLAIRAAGDHCVLFARTRGGADSLPLHQRLQEQFTEFTDENRAVRNVPFRDILMMLGDFDFVWVHQFLSCDAVFDIIATLNSTQKMLMTNLGHEPLASQFAAFYCQPKNHYFVEISRYAAQRSLSFGPQSVGVTGAIWRADLLKTPTSIGEYSPKRICTVGRVLPHKGIDVTVRALPAGWELDVVGPFGGQDYVDHLKLLARGKIVRFSGAIPEADKRSLVARALALVASSCHNLYDGRQIPQAELLGLVIFEAVTLNSLPITSDIPSFKEVMGDLGLSAYIYAAGDEQELNQLLQKTATLGVEERSQLVEKAATVVEERYLWDDYWLRVKAAIGNDPEGQPGTLPALRKT